MTNKEECEKVKRQKHTYLVRSLTPQEVDEIRSIGWRSSNKLIVNTILEENDAGMSRAAIEGKIAAQGYDPYFLYYYEVINSRLSQKKVNIRLTYLPEGALQKGPYKFLAIE